MPNQDWPPAARGRQNRALQVSSWPRFLPLLGLCGFALAQPLLDPLARHGGFWVAHQVSTGELAALVAALLLGPPLLAWGSVRAAAAVHPAAGRALLLALVAGLLMLATLPPARRLLGESAALSLGAAAACGCGGAWLFARSRAARRFAAVLGAAPLVFAGSFASSGVAGQLGTARALELGAVGSRTPVVLVVFDALPLSSLLDARFEIDAETFPHFAALARTSTWFPNASAVDWQTIHAVPALVTGRRSTGGLPTAVEYPFNLFTWLGASYETRVVETHTLLAPSTRRASAARRGARLRALASDLQVLYLHVVAPQAWAARLPAVSHTWKGFRSGDAAPAPALPGASDPGRDERFRRHVNALHSPYARRGERFRAFVDSIGPCAGGCLHFLHVLLPHWSWQYTPSGRSYLPSRAYGLRMKEFRWGEDPWWMAQGYQQHLVQLVFVDRLLGSLVARLREVGLFERTALVITADHGEVFLPGAERRRPNRAAHPEEILSVPLLAKAPFQTRGRVEARNVESIDVLPLIADLIDAPLPFPVEGCSPLDPGCPERDAKTLVGDDRLPLRFPPRIEQPTAGLRFKLEVFGDAPGLAGLYAIGPHPELVGQPLASLEPPRRDPGARVALLREPIALARRAPDQVALGRVTGWLRDPGAAGGPPGAVAVELGGVIAAVAPLLPAMDGTPAFSALVPEPPPGPLPELRIHLVSGPREQLRLRQARIEWTDAEPAFPAGSGLQRGSGQPD